MQTWRVVREEGQPTKLEMTVETAQALRASGGSLYITSVGAGMPQARTGLPTTISNTTPFRGDGWVVYIDQDIAPPTRWVIKRKRFPWRRFVALYDPTDIEWELGGPGDIVEGVLTYWH